MAGRRTGGDLDPSGTVGAPLTRRTSSWCRLWMHGVGRRTEGGAAHGAHVRHPLTVGYPRSDVAGLLQRDKPNVQLEMHGIEEHGIEEHMPVIIRLAAHPLRHPTVSSTPRIAHSNWQAELLIGPNPP